MYEKVNPYHPDKQADRIAGALVDLAYKQKANPRIAVEVLLGHGECVVLTESDVALTEEEVSRAVERIAGDVTLRYRHVPQDRELARNQAHRLRCGDNGIFRGVPTTGEQKELTAIARAITESHPSDGKYILDGQKLIICQSNADGAELRSQYPDATINPLGSWTGGTDVDTGATNRKIGSDMGDAATGGGLHGKDLSKADVSVNIYAHLKAQHTGRPVELSCAIGDTFVDGKPYPEIVGIARDYIAELGGFEKFAEWGLIR